MIKTFVATSPIALEDKIARFMAENGFTVILQEILTERDGKYIKTVKLM